jgi:hypothetical protein
MNSEETNHSDNVESSGSSEVPDNGELTGLGHLLRVEASLVA